MKYYRSIISVVEKAKKDGLVLYGAGFWGKYAYNIFKLFDVEPVCFCDDDVKKIGSEYMGVSVISLSETAEKYPGALFIACADNTNAHSTRSKMNARLDEYGLRSDESGFHPLRYLFLLDGILDDECGSDNLQSNLKGEDFTGIIVLNSMGNSGAKYVESLFDWHPQIYNLPGLGCFIDIIDAYENRLKYLSDQELVIETMAQLAGMFEVEAVGDTIRKETNERFWQSFLIYDKDGDEVRDIYVSPRSFYYHLRNEMKEAPRGFEGLLRKVYAAYNKTINKPVREGKKWLLFHDHKVGKKPEDYNGLFREDTEVKFFYVIRNPIQQLFSMIRHYELHQVDQIEFFLKRKWKEIFSCSIGVSFLIANDFGYERDVRMVRFEDCKKHIEEMGCTISEYLSICYDPILRTTTANGIQIYNRTKNNANKMVVEEGGSTTAIDRKDYSEIFSEEDVIGLKYLFSKMIQEYYEAELVSEKSEGITAERIKACLTKFSFFGIWKRWAKEAYGEESFEIKWDEFMRAFSEYCEKMYRFIMDGQEKDFFEVLMARR